MIKMLSKLHIPMSPRCNVKVTLHLIPLQAPKDPTRLIILIAPPPRHWRTRKLSPPLPRSPQIIMHILLMTILHRLLPPPIIRLVSPPRSHPRTPLCSFPLQQFRSEDAVAGRVLHVDVEVWTAHGDDDVEVHLHVVGDAAFDGEGVGGGAGEPAGEFGVGEPEAG
jgi:hypothetical protein